MEDTTEGQPSRNSDSTRASFMLNLRQRQSIALSRFRRGGTTIGVPYVRIAGKLAPALRRRKKYRILFFGYAVPYG
jgi:hypothetical protein